ncbi:MAG: hypothetical protein ACRC3Y_18105 [Romboutsia sp.]|uniref:hypothetical protein n=1 Tax=Romboutsia sp. TaxID=1965302 RepID=UPI003F2DC8AA
MTKEKLIKKYDKYIQLLGEVGGALDVEDFIFLLNVKYSKEISEGTMKEFTYSKVVRKFRELNKVLQKEDNDFELLNVYRSTIEKEVGVPENIYIMCLTQKGWYYYDKSRRGEVKFESTGKDIMKMIRFKAFKRIVCKEHNENHQYAVEFILKYYNKKVNEIWLRNKKIVELEEILSNDKLIIKSFIFFRGDDEVEPCFNLEVLYIQDTIVYKHLCETIDGLLGVLERTYALYANDDTSIPDIELKIDCVSTNRINVSRFIKYRNKYQRVYSYYDFVHKNSLSKKNFRAFFGKTIKRTNYYTMNSKYELTKY